MAVLHIYEQDGVRMADHHMFLRFFMDSTPANTIAPGVFRWIRSMLPPISESLAPTCHAQFSKTICPFHRSTADLSVPMGAMALVVRKDPKQRGRAVDRKEFCGSCNFSKTGPVVALRNESGSSVACFLDIV